MAGDGRRYTGRSRLIADDDFKRAKEIQKIGEMTGGMPPVPTKDLPIFGTSAVRNIGGSVTIGVNRKERAIALNAADEQASVCSITLDAFGAQCFAYIQFGAGGVFSELEVDIGRGTALDLVLSSLNVDLINDSTVPGGSDALVKAFAGWMPSSGHPSSRPTRTFKRTVGYIQSGYQQPITAGFSLDLVPAAAARFMTPPNFAKDLIIQRTSFGTAGAFTLTFLDETGAVPLYEASFGTGAIMDEPIELSNDCKLVRLTNDAPGVTTFRAIWGLGV